LPKVALILSSGRTGTRFLAHYFDANYRDVIARHEPPPRALLRMASYARASGRLSTGAMRRLLRGARRRVAASEAALYLESNPFLSGFIEVVDDVFDEPVILHVVRDPRDYARSSLNHGTSRGARGIANRLVPFWFPDLRGLPEIGPHPDWLERTAGLWTIVNRLLAEAGSRCAHYHLFRYEEMFDATHSGLREMCRVLGLEFRETDLAVTTADRINPGHLDLLPAWTEWPAERCAALQRICSPLMQRYGYGTEPAWLDRVSGHG
jgi:hypothetical protein